MSWLWNMQAAYAHSTRNQKMFYNVGNIEIKFQVEIIYADFQAVQFFKNRYNTPHNIPAFQ